MDNEIESLGDKGATSFAGNSSAGGSGLQQSSTLASGAAKAAQVFNGLAKVVPFPFSAACTACSVLCSFAVNAMYNHQYCISLAKRVARLQPVMTNICSTIAATSTASSSSSSSSSFVAVDPKYGPVFEALHQHVQECIAFLKSFEKPKDASRVDAIKAFLRRVRPEGERFAALHEGFNRILQDAVFISIVPDVHVGPSADDCAKYTLAMHKETMTSLEDLATKSNEQKELLLELRTLCAKMMEQINRNALEPPRGDYLYITNFSQFFAVVRDVYEAAAEVVSHRSRCQVLTKVFRGIDQALRVQQLPDTEAAAEAFASLIITAESAARLLVEQADATIDDLVREERGVDDKFTEIFRRVKASCVSLVLNVPELDTAMDQASREKQAATDKAELMHTLNVMAVTAGDHQVQLLAAIANMKKETVANRSQLQQRPWLISMEQIEMEYRDARRMQRKVLGRGGFGEVVAGFFGGQPVAIKLLPDFPEAAEMIEQELNICFRLRHPNIVKMFGATIKGELSDIYSIVMERLEGGSLEDQITKGHRLPIPLKLALTAQFVSAMHYLHTSTPQIIHRDLKPANVLLTGDLKRIRVVDFGLAVTKSSMKSNMTGGSQAGTLCYTPPEILQRRPYSTKADVYSFGITIYEFFYMKGAWDCGSDEIAAKVMKGERPPLTPRPDDVPEVVQCIIQACLAQSPDDRPSFATIQAVFYLLDTVPEQALVAARQMLPLSMAGGSSLSSSDVPRLPPVDIPSFLRSLKLTKDYVDVFAQQGIDGDTFMELDAQALRQAVGAIGDSSKIEKAKEFYVMTITAIVGAQRKAAADEGRMRTMINDTQVRDRNAINKRAQEEYLALRERPEAMARSKLLQMEDQQRSWLSLLQKHVLQLISLFKQRIRDTSSLAAVWLDEYYHELRTAIVQDEEADMAALGTSFHSKELYFSQISLAMAAFRDELFDAQRDLYTAFAPIQLELLRRELNEAVRSAPAVPPCSSPRWAKYPVHMVKDTEAAVCMSCGITDFTWRVRRHHCRNCGRIVCRSCMPETQTRMIDGKPEPTCTFCMCVLEPGKVSGPKKTPAELMKEACFFSRSSHHAFRVLTQPPFISVLASQVSSICPDDDDFDIGDVLILYAHLLLASSEQDRTAFAKALVSFACGRLEEEKQAVCHRLTSILAATVVSQFPILSVLRPGSKEMSHLHCSPTTTTGILNMCGDLMAFIAGADPYAPMRKNTVVSRTMVAQKLPPLLATDETSRDALLNLLAELCSGDDLTSHRRKSAFATPLMCRSVHEARLEPLRLARVLSSIISGNDPHCYRRQSAFATDQTRDVIITALEDGQLGEAERNDVIRCLLLMTRHEAGGSDECQALFATHRLSDALFKIIRPSNVSVETKQLVVGAASNMMKGPSGRSRGELFVKAPFRSLFLSMGAEAAKSWALARELANYIASGSQICRPEFLTREAHDVLLSAVSLASTSDDLGVFLTAVQSLVISRPGADDATEVEAARACICTQGMRDGLWNAVLRIKDLTPVIATATTDLLHELVTGSKERMKLIVLPSSAAALGKLCSAAVDVPSIERHLKFIHDVWKENEQFEIIAAPMLKDLLERVESLPQPYLPTTEHVFFALLRLMMDTENFAALEPRVGFFCTPRILRAMGTMVMSPEAPEASLLIFFLTVAKMATGFGPPVDSRRQTIGTAKFFEFFCSMASDKRITGPSTLLWLVASVAALTDFHSAAGLQLRQNFCATPNFANIVFTLGSRATEQRAMQSVAAIIANVTYGNGPDADEFRKNMYANASFRDLLLVFGKAATTSELVASVCLAICNICSQTYAQRKDMLEVRRELFATVPTREAYVSMCSYANTPVAAECLLQSICELVSTVGYGSRGDLRKQLLYTDDFRQGIAKVRPFASTRTALEAIRLMHIDLSPMSPTNQQQQPPPDLGRVVNDVVSLIRR